MKSAFRSRRYRASSRVPMDTASPQKPGNASSIPLPVWGTAPTPSPAHYASAAPTSSAFTPGITTSAPITTFLPALIGGMQRAADAYEMDVLLHRGDNGDSSEETVCRNLMGPPYRRPHHSYQRLGPPDRSSAKYRPAGRRDHRRDHRHSLGRLRRCGGDAASHRPSLGKRAPSNRFPAALPLHFTRWKCAAKHSSQRCARAARNLLTSPFFL